MSEKYKIVAILGKSASGKDSIQRKLVEQLNAHGIVSTTTRPIRSGEVEGVDYYFVNSDEFARKIINYEMLEATSFNDWCYGTEISALSKDNLNIGVFNPEGVANIIEDNRLEVFPIEITTNARERIHRSLFREDNPDIYEIFRRYLADEEDFDKIDFKREIVENDQQLSKTVQMCMKLILDSGLVN